ncbi:MAG: sulfatase-like hydrolase/transferase [Acidimicrobiia bacterium]|nr:sulfatase-like hydrolase/transferase [Acidimicrobiia bacterium]
MAPDAPNVLIVMTDEERTPPPYELEALAEFRRTQLPARQHLRDTGVELHRHIVASTACLPSRTSLFCGQYPSLHGVRSTDGLTKDAYDPAMRWLDPSSVPTMGDWFRAAGYRTHYRGKWHISHADLLVPGTHKALMANTTDGSVVPEVVELYRRADRLDPFGFSGWIGREPHGAHPADTGYVRDGVFADQVCELMAELSASRHEGPWLAVASFVNPHDIAFSGFGWESLGFPEVPDDIPAVPEAPSQSDSLDDRPTAQAQFRDVWPKMLYRQPADETYRRFYHWLHVLVDAAISRVLDALERSGMADDTIVVFTSDHGDMLGAHGGMQQKWHTAYDEAIRVPLVMRGPGIDPTAVGPTGITTPTSHVDLLPTLLSLVGADPDALAPTLAQTHTEVHPLVGEDRSGLLRGGVAPSTPTPVYFMTDDEMSRGLRHTNRFTGKDFEPVGQPAKIESVIATVPEAGGTERLWKLNRYHAHLDPERTEVADQWELHDLDGDPEERTNRFAAEPEVAAALQRVLERRRAEVRLRPTHTTPVH